MKPSSLQEKNPTDPFYYFIHIEKTGGLTFNGMMVSQFQESQIFMGDLHSLLKKQGDGKTIVETKKYRYTRLHFPIHPFLFDREVVYLTMLRNPIERTLSLYKQDIRGLRGKKIPIPSLQEWLMKDERSWNAQTRLLSGNWIGARGSREVEKLLELPERPLENPGYLQTAKNNIRENITFFGITDYFYESFQLFTMIFNQFKISEYQSYNIAPKAQEIELASGDIEALKRNNSLDLELYEYAKEQFFNCILEAKKIGLTMVEEPSTQVVVSLNQKIQKDSLLKNSCNICENHRVRRKQFIGFSDGQSNCGYCGSTARGQLMVATLDMIDKKWLQKDIHEFNPQLQFIFNKKKNYQTSFFHWDVWQNPEKKANIEMLGNLSLVAKRLDYFLTINAFDFVGFHKPIISEVMGKLKSGGKFLFTLEINKQVDKTFQRVIFMPDGPEPLYKAKYCKGSLGGDLLVAWEFGTDYLSLLSDWISPYRYHYYSDSLTNNSDYKNIVVIIENHK